MLDQTGLQQRLLAAAQPICCQPRRSSWRRHSRAVYHSAVYRQSFSSAIPAHELPRPRQPIILLASACMPHPCLALKHGQTAPPFAQQHLTLSGAEICGVKGRGTSSFRGPTSLRSAAGPPQEPPEDNAPPAQRGRRRHLAAVLFLACEGLPSYYVMHACAFTCIHNASGNSMVRPCAFVMHSCTFCRIYVDSSAFRSDTFVYIHGHSCAFNTLCIRVHSERAHS